MAKKIFIDGGAHRGESIERLYKRFPDAEKYEIHSFEPNPLLWKYLEDKPTTLHKEAIWVGDGITSFYLAAYSEASTLLKDKTTGAIDYDKPLIVACIDLDRWIKENFSEDDYIVLKLDLEGAEYYVLKHMIKNGSIKYINELYGEFHTKKVDSLPRKGEKELRQTLLDINLPLNEWH